MVTARLRSNVTVRDGRPPTGLPLNRNVEKEALVPKQDAVLALGIPIVITLRQVFSKLTLNQNATRHRILLCRALFTVPSLFIRLVGFQHLPNEGRHQLHASLALE